MYKVLVDGALMCDSRIEELALSNPVAKLEEGKVGSFSFVIPPEHPKIDAIKRRKSVIEVIEDEEILFRGICIEVSEDFYKQKTIYCESDLTFFNDTIQRPTRYQGKTVRGLAEAYVSNHNAQADENKRFTVGMVTVQDENDYISCYTNMESTMACFKADLVDDLGGFLQVRYENGVRYLDYLADSLNTNKQTIKLGKNLIDYTSNIDSTDIATAIIPLGAKLAESSIEGLDERLTIKSVNNGLDYVFNQDAVNSYGWIYKTVTWDDVTTPEALKTKAERYLTEVQFENVVIEAKALDLHFEDSSIEKFKLSDKIRVISAPHGLNKYFRLTKLTRNLNNPEKDTIILGKDERLSLTAKSNKENAAIKQEIEKSSNSIKEQAIENATQLITNAMGGYVYKTNEELYIMDTDNPETATKVWRWNINGLGYSSKGINGPYGLAMTMDGRFVANAITVDGLEVGKNVAMGADASISWSQISDGTKQATQITKDTVTTSYVNALKVKAGSVDAENISGTTISGKTISGGTISGTAINNGNGTFEVDEKGNVVANSFSSANATITGGSLKVEVSNLLKSVIEVVGKSTYSEFNSLINGNGFYHHNVTNGRFSALTGQGLSGGTYSGNSYTNDAYFDVLNGVFRAVGTGSSSTCGHLVVLNNLTVNGSTSLSSSPVITSDRDLKKDIEDITQEDATNFIYSLKPCQFKYKNGTSDRFHHGFIAQEIKESMGANDWGLYVCNSENQEKGLRYEELIADLVATVQSQNKRIKILEEGIGD